MYAVCKGRPGQIGRGRKIPDYNNKTGNLTTSLIENPKLQKGFSKKNCFCLSTAAIKAT